MDEQRVEWVADGGYEASRQGDRASMDRRTWMRIVSGSVMALGGMQWRVRAGQAAEDTNADEVKELRLAEERARKTTERPLLTLKSAHYQAIGDASEAFIKLTLSDCEKMATDYINHFRSKGFDVKLPARRLTLIVFRDERPFLRLAEKTPPGTMGFYSLASNWLALFDFRNMPMYPYASGQTNMETLTHEATHQLS